MKKIISIVLSFVLASTCSLPAFATSLSNDIEVPQNSWRIVDAGAKVLNKDESVIALMESKNLSYNEALQEYDQQVARLQRLEERYITYDAGMGYLVEVGCQVKVACGSGHCNYMEVIKEWSEASGSGDYTWNAFYVTVTIEGDLDDTLRFQTRGTLEVAVESSMTTGFEAAGFSVSGTVGGTTYFRKTISVNQTL